MSLYDKSSLVLIPSGTKTGKVYSQVPVSGDGDFTFTRSSAATRVNADGFIEKETSNLMLQSNAFNNWSGDPTLTSGQTGYDGSSDAWLLDATSVNQFIYRNDVTSFSGVTTISVYAKKGTADGIRLRFNQSSDANIYINLINGSDVGAASGTISHNVTNLGSGWYRIEMSFIASGSQDFRIYPTDVTGTSVVGSIYIQDVQAEQGLVARDYIETTTTAVEGGITDNVPRLDYTDSSCPALLLEPQRTNSVDYSEYYNLFHVNVTLTTNAGTSPEGVDNASKIVVSSQSQPRIERFNTWSNSTTYSMSAYVKADTGRYIGFGLYSPEMGNQWVRFDLTNETFGYNDTYWSNAAIVDAGNNWYKISATITTDAVNSSRSGFKLVSMKSDAYNIGTIGDSFFVYGLQVETGSYATSYIPTYGSSVTRVQDSFYDNNYQANNIFGANSGSIFFDFGDDFTLFDGVSNSYPIDRMQFVDITSYGGGYMRFRGGESNHYFQLVSMGAADNSLSFTNQTKYCICWDSNGVDFYGDGALIDSTTIEIVPSINRIENGLSGTQRETRIKEILFFTTKLSSQEAIDLTTIV